MTGFPQMTAEGMKPSPVSRRTARTWDGRRRLVVTLEGGDIIACREEGRRLTVREPAASFYCWAMKRMAAELYKQKKAERRARRMARNQQ